MIQLNQYILEKLHLSKDIKVKESDIRCIFCQVRSSSKKNYIVPDIIEVIKESESEIKFVYLTNYFNSKGKEKTLKISRRDGRNEYKGLYSNEKSSKHFVILDKEKSIELFEKIADKCLDVLFCYIEDILYDDNYPNFLKTSKDILAKANFKSDKPLNYNNLDLFYKLYLNDVIDKLKKEA